MVHGGTGAPKTLSLKILDAILDNPNALKYIAVIHHDTDDVRDLWEKKNRKIVLDRFDTLLKRMKPLDGVIDQNGLERDGVERTFRFEEMPHEESDIS